MNKIATIISAASLAVVSVSASAWGWGDNGFGDGWGDGWADGGFNFNMSASGHGHGYGRGYNHYYDGYGPYYGYAPYGYGFPVQPAVELTDEQKQAIADQQARFAADMQKAQQQAAEYYAAQPFPGDAMRAQGDAFRARMDAEHEARILLGEPQPETGDDHSGQVAEAGRRNDHE